jgi:hypothetical protein
MVTITSLYDSLLDASYGGVAFLYVDSRDEIGRRALRFQYPGSDVPGFQDLGQDDGPIHITGKLIGDDHVHQAQRLRTAFALPGPGTLVHPWLGTLQVVAASRAVFSDAQDQGRCTNFEAEFWRADARVPPSADMLSDLLDRLDALRLAARALLRQALAPVALAASIVGYVARYAGMLRSWFEIVAGGGLLGVVQGSLAGLSGITAIVPGSGYADAVADTIAAPSAALLAASVPPTPSAVGPGESAVAAVAVDGRLTAAACLAVANSAASVMTDPLPGPEMSLASRALLLADAASAADDIAFTSAQEAVAWRDRVASALDAAASDAAIAASTAAAPASAAALGAVWDGLIATRAAWMAEMSSVIGSLPNVASLTLPAPALLWLVAAYLAGDDPAAIPATLADLATRNGLRRLDLVAGPLEILT